MNKNTEGVCNIAPGGLKTECIALFDQFGPNIVDLLIKHGNDTKRVCQTIKICPASTSSTQSTQVVEMARADPPLCSLCQFIVKYADNLIIQNKTEQQIVTALGMANCTLKNKSVLRLLLQDFSSSRLSCQFLSA